MGDRRSRYGNLLTIIFVDSIGAIQLWSLKCIFGTFCPTKKSPAKEITDAMDGCPSLQYLNLEGNTLGVDAARAIGKALEKHPEFKRALFKDLFTGRLKTEIPQALRLMGNGMNTAGAHLTVFDCSDNALGPNGMVGLVDLFKSPSCYSLQVSYRIQLR